MKELQDCKGVSITIAKYCYELNIILNCIYRYTAAIYINIQLRLAAGSFWLKKVKTIRPRPHAAFTYIIGFWFCLFALEQHDTRKTHSFLQNIKTAHKSSETQ